MRDFWTVAQTCWGEARGEGFDGLVAVVWVVRNRHERHPRWLGKTLTAICKAPYQFSCWNYGDPNYLKIQYVALDDAAFVEALRATTGVLGGLLSSPVGGATHYYAASITVPPRWAEGKEPVCVIGNHTFFADIA